jgi:hypothetical protein
MWAIVSLFIPYFQIEADVFNFPEVAHEKNAQRH